jgi:hypothetical protein
VELKPQMPLHRNSRLRLTIRNRQSIKAAPSQCDAVWRIVPLPAISIDAGKADTDVAE